MYLKAGQLGAADDIPLLPSGTLVSLPPGEQQEVMREALRERALSEVNYDSRRKGVIMEAGIAALGIAAGLTLGHAMGPLMKKLFGGK